MSKRGYSAVALCHPKTPANVGSVLRAAHNYKASMVVMEGQRFPTHMPTDTPAAHRHIPFLKTDDVLSVMPMGCEAVAVELEPGATPIQNFTHPERAFYILGPEDGSVPKEVSSRCKHHVYVPTRDCMNLAATANVILFDRMMKRKEYEVQP